MDEAADQNERVETDGNITNVVSAQMYQQKTGYTDNIEKNKKLELN